MPIVFKGIFVVFNCKWLVNLKLHSKIESGTDLKEQSRLHAESLSSGCQELLPQAPIVNFARCYVARRASRRVRFGKWRLFVILFWLLLFSVIDDRWCQNQKPCETCFPVMLKWPRSNEQLQGCKCLNQLQIIVFSAFNMQLPGF